MKERRLMDIEIYAKRVLGARNATRTEAGRLASSVLELVEEIKRLDKELSDVSWRMANMRDTLGQL